MVEEYSAAQLKNLLDASESIMVLCAHPEETDCLATALVWNQVLVEQGKDSRVSAPRRPQASEATQALTGQDALATELGNQNLTVSFDYSEEKVDKVSYHISEDNQKFFLTIKPKSGVQPLESEKVEFSYTGASSDLLLIVGANAPEELKQLYTGYEDLYANTSSVVISSQPGFGTIQLAPTAGGSLSSLTIELLTLLNFPISPDAANNLLYGLEDATQGLSKVSTPEQFEQVASLLRAGAERRWQPKQPKPAPVPEQPKKPAGKLVAGKSREVVVEKKKPSAKKSPARG